MEITVPIKMLQKKKHIQLHMYIVFHRVDKDFPLSRPWSPDTNGATCRLDIVDLIPEQFSLSVMEEWGSPDHLVIPGEVLLQQVDALLGLHQHFADIVVLVCHHFLLSMIVSVKEIILKFHIRRGVAWHKKLIHQCKSPIALADAFWKFIFSLNEAYLNYNSCSRNCWFLKTHKIHSKRILIFQKSTIFIQNKYSYFQNLVHSF